MRNLVQSGHELRRRAQFALRNILLSIIPAQINNDDKLNQAMQKTFDGNQLHTLINRLVCDSNRLRRKYCILKNLMGI